MSTLVLSGAGTVGPQVVRALVARGAKVRVLTRSADKTKGLPRGVETATGDLLDPGTLETISTPGSASR